MSTRTTTEISSSSAATKTPESTTVDSKATSLSEFEVAVALFKSFFNVPGLNLETVEQLNKLEKIGLRLGLLTVYSTNGVLTYTRPPSGDFMRYMMDIHTPEYLTVSVYTDGAPISFRLKAKGELECKPDDQSQMERVQGFFKKKESKFEQAEASEPSVSPLSTAGAIRKGAQDISASSQQLEAVLSQVHKSGLIDKATKALKSAESMSDKISDLLPNISTQVKGVMSVLGITCGAILATVTVVLIFYIVRKVLLSMTKKKALQVIMATAGILVLAGIACHEFSTAGAMLGKYAAWLKDQWTTSVRAVGSIAWNMTAPTGDELLKRMVRDKYVPARHSLMIIELSETICRNVGWAHGLKYLTENIHFMPPDAAADSHLDPTVYTFIKSVHDRSFSTVTAQSINSMGDIFALTDDLFIEFLEVMARREHESILRSQKSKGNSSIIGTLESAIPMRAQHVGSSLQNFYNAQEELHELRTLPQDYVFTTDAEKRKARLALVRKNKDDIEQAELNKRICKQALRCLNITNMQTRTFIRRAAVELSATKWFRAEVFDYSKPVTLPASLANQLVKPVAVVSKPEAHKEGDAVETDVKETKALDTSQTDVPPSDEAQGNDDGLNSMFALMLALVRRFQNPQADTWDLFKKLRNDSNNFKVGMTGATFLLKCVPDSLRVAAFTAVGLGDPDDISQQQRDIIARAFHIHKFMCNKDAQTTANKIVWKTCFDHLAHLMSPEFMTQKSSYTLSLCNKAYSLMLGQLAMINTIPDTAGHRPCTIGIWLFGDPGCGKSTLCSHLAQSLFANHPPNLRRHTWALNEKYITGFKSNHASIEVDDLGSNIPALQQADFWGQALTMLSTKPVTVAQADLASKGMNFNAFAMFLQSNMTADQVLGACTEGRFLTNPEAVKRRFRGNNGVLAEVILQPEYRDADGNADEVKIGLAAQADPSKTPWVKYKVAGELLDYDAFVAKIVGCLTAALYEYKRNCEVQKPGCHVNEYLLQTLDEAREKAGISATYGVFPDAKEAMKTLDQDLLSEHRREVDVSQMMAPPVLRDMSPGAPIFRNFVPVDQPQMMASDRQRYKKKGSKASFYASTLRDVPNVKAATGSGHSNPVSQLTMGHIDTRRRWKTRTGDMPCGYWEETTKEGKSDLLWNSSMPARKSIPFESHNVPFKRGKDEEQQALARFCEMLTETVTDGKGVIETDFIVHEHQFLNDQEGSMSVSRVPWPDRCCTIKWETKGTKTIATITGLPNHPSAHCASFIADIRDTLAEYIGDLNFCDLPEDVRALTDGQRTIYLSMLSTCPQGAESFLRNVRGIQEEKGFTRAQQSEWDAFAGDRDLPPDALKAFKAGRTVQQFADSFKDAVNAEQAAEMDEAEGKLVRSGFLPDLLDYPTRAVTSIKTIIHEQWLKIKGAYEHFVTSLAKINWTTVAKALGILLGVSAVAYGGWRLFQHYSEKSEDTKVTLPSLGTGIVAATATVTAAAMVEDGLDDLVVPCDASESLDDRQHDRTRLQHQGVLPTKSVRPHRVFTAVRPNDTGQGVAEPCEEPYLRNVVKNTCSFSPHALFNEHHHGAALFIIGRRLLMNVHYIGATANKTDFPKAVTVRQHGQDFHASMRWEDLDFFSDGEEKTDFMVWRMPAGAVTIPDHPKIYQHFPRKSELREVYIRSPHTKSQAPYFLRAHTEEVQRHDLDVVRVSGNVQIYNGNLDGKDYKMPLAATYASDHHKAGWCGSLVVTSRVILGVHAVGRNMGDVSGYSTGIAQVFTFEMFERYMRDKPQMMVELDECSVDQAPPNSAFGVFADKRGLKPGQAFMEFSLPSITPLATKTRYVETGLAERGSILAQLNDKVPSVLHHRDPRYTGSAKSGPEFQASLLLRYENPPRGEPGHRPMLHPRVLAGISAKLSDIPVVKDVRVWTLDEALNPRHHGSVLNPIPRSTSSGILHKGPGKKHYIGYDEHADLYFAQGGLEGKVANFLSTVDQGKLPLTIYAEFCKDELRTRKKIAATAARTISGSPFTLTMVTTMCYGAFLDAFQRVPHYWGHTVGVDIMGRQWDKMIRKLILNAPEGFDGDFKAFDTTMSYQFMHSFFEHVDKWYRVNGTWSQSDRALRWACIYSLCFSKHACGKTVFTMFSGMCSGSRLTTIMNCFWSKTLIMYAYASLAPDDNVLGTRNFTLDGFDRFVVFYVLGDDNFGSVKPEIAHWFNPAAISRALANIGITYTPAKKNTEHSTTLRPVEELEFLANTTGSGNGFDFIPYMKYYPVIKTSSLAKMVAYMKPSALPGRDPCTATADNLTAALLAVHLSGEERFDMVRQSVKIFRELYPHSEYKFPTFQELSLKFLPLEPPNIVDVHQGITMSKTSTNVTNVQSSGVELNQDNSLETKTAVDARAGLDAPNVPVCQVAALQQGAPFPASAETVTFAPVMGITPVLEKPDTSTINTGNDMDLQSLMRMTWRDTFEWKSIAPEGTILWQTRICPNGQLLDESFGLNEIMQPTALASVSSLYRYWHGGITMSFSAVMSGVHVGRLGICVIYGSNDFPTTFGQLTEQRYAVAAFDGMTKDVTIVLPYVATTRLKQTLTGSGPDDIEKCCTGTVSIFVMNQLRAPQSASTGITVNVLEGAAPDLKLYVPGANASTTYLFDALETPDLKRVENKVVEYTNRRDVHQMMSTETPQATTSQTGADMPVVMSSVSDTAVLPSNPIIKTPQTLLLLFRRQYVFGNNVNGVSSTLRSCNVTAPFAVGGLAQSNLEPWMRLTDMHKYAKYFRVWYGPGLFSVYDQSGLNGITMSYHPTVTGPVVNAGPFNSGTAQYDQTAFSGAWMFAPPRMGFANAVAPFTTPNNVLIVPHFQEELNSDGNSGAMQFQISDAKARTAFTFSGGDGLHLGIRFAVPLMKCGAFAVQPDTWTAAPVNRLRQIRDQYQMDTGSVAVTGTDKVGVTLLEQANEVVEEVHSVVPNTSDTKIIGQPQLDFCHFLERDQWLANFEWKTNDPVGEIMYNRPVPFGLFKNTAQRAIEAFRYFKMDVVVTVKVQATQFHQGRLCLLSMPMTSDQTTRSVLFADDAKYAVEVPVEKRRTNWTFGNHAFVDAAASSTVTFTIPFRYIRPYLVKDENFAELYIAVFNPLRVGIGGSVAASCTVFVHFERCDLRVINPL